MSTIQIPGLPELITVEDTDLFIIREASSSVDKKLQASNLLAYIEDNIDQAIFGDWALVTSANQTDYLLINQSGVNRKIELSNLEESFSFYDGSDISISGSITFNSNNTISENNMTGSWNMNSGQFSEVQALYMNPGGVLYVGDACTLTSSGSLGVMTGDWSFSAGTLTNVASLTATTLTDGTLSINSGAITGGTNLTLSGTIDLGTNTLSDGNFNGDWSFNTGTLTNVASLTATTLTDGTLSINSGAITGGTNLTLSGTIDLGTNTLSDGNFNGDWSFNSASLSGVLSVDSDSSLALKTSDSSRITIDDSGNITVESGALVQSSDYASGVTGWRIGGNQSNAEFNNLRARGVLETVVFKKNEVSVSSGDVLFSSATVIVLPIASTDTRIYLEEQVFSVGNRLRMKNSTDSELMKVTATGTDGTGIYVDVTRDLEDSYPTTNPTWKVDTPIASVEDRVQIIVNDGSNAPYMDVIQRTGDTTEVLKARYGNLTGIAGASGWGLWSENVFLTGDITATTLTATTAGTIAGFSFDEDKLYATNIELSASGKHLHLGTGTDVVYLDGDEGIWAGNTVFASAPFSVTKAGAVKAISGTIGGFTITDTQIKSSDNVLVLNSDGSASLGGVTIDGAGNTTISGTLSAVDGVFTGTLSGASGSFSGTVTTSNITATGGTIGGFTLSSTSLTATNTVLNSNGSGVIGPMAFSAIADRLTFSSGTEFKGDNLIFIPTGNTHNYVIIKSEGLADLAGIILRDSADVESTIYNDAGVLNIIPDVSTYIQGDLDMAGDIGMGTSANQIRTSSDSTSSSLVFNGTYPAAITTGSSPTLIADNSVSVGTIQYSTGYVNRIASVCLAGRVDTSGGYRTDSGSVVFNGFFFHATAQLVSYDSIDGTTSDHLRFTVTGISYSSGTNQTTVNWTAHTRGLRWSSLITVFGRTDE